MKPVNGWIICEKLDHEEKTAGGIIIPEQVKKEIKTNNVKVLAISDDVFDACKREKRDLPYSVGDVICVHSQTGIPLNASDKDDKRYWYKFDAAMGVDSNV